MEEAFKHRAQQLSECLNELTKMDEELIAKFNDATRGVKHDVTVPDELLAATFIQFLNAFVANNESIRILASELEMNLFLDHPIGLILRNSAGLSLRLFYFIHLLNTDDKNFELFTKELYAYHSDSHDNIVGYLKAKKATGERGFADRSIDELMNEVKNNSPVYRSVLEKWDGTNSKSVRYIFKELKQQSKIKGARKIQPGLQKLAHVYEAWEYYSKYEHLTILSDELKFKSESLEALERLRNVMYIVCYALDVITWPLKDKNGCPDYKSLANKMLKI